MNTIKTTIISYPYSSETREVVIPFEYLKRDFVIVTLEGLKKPILTLELNVDYKFTSKTTITMLRTYKPDEGYTRLTIKRLTDATKRIVNYQDGSILNALELNISQLQSIHIAEEARDLSSQNMFIDSEGNLDARGRRIVNLGTPIEETRSEAVNIEFLYKTENSILTMRDEIKEAVAVGIAKGYCDSIEDLRLLEPSETPEGMTIEVKAYYKGGNLGGGLFIFDKNDKISPDNGGTIVVTRNGNRWKRLYDKLYATDFGVDNKGIEDMSETVQKALLVTNTLYFVKGTYRTTGLTLGMNQSLIGEGRTVTVIKHTGNKACIRTQNTSKARNMIKGFMLLHEGDKGSSIGINTSDSSFVRVEDVSIFSFHTGILDNDGQAPLSFSARNNISDFEVNSCTKGILSIGGNINVYMGGRLFGNDNSIILSNTEALTFINMNVERSTIQLTTSNKATASFYGGYFEAGSGNENFNMDSTSKIDFYSVKINGKRGFINIDPNYTSSHLDIPDTASSFGKFSGIPAAHKQYIKDYDFSRELGLKEYWTSLGDIQVSKQFSGFESGNCFLKLKATSTLSRVQTKFNIEPDVKNMTLTARLRHISGTCKIEVRQGSLVLSQYVNDKPHLGWTTVILRIPAINSINPKGGPLIVEISPDMQGGSGELYIDQIWCTKGTYASAPRAYKQGVEVLVKPKVLLEEKRVNKNKIDSAITPSGIPTGAIGMRIRVTLKADLASQFKTSYTIANTSCLLESHFNGGTEVREFTLNSTTFTGVLTISSSSNLADYKVELIEWVID